MPPSLAFESESQKGLVEQLQARIAELEDQVQRSQQELELSKASHQAAEARLRYVLDNTTASLICFRVYADCTWEYEYQSAGAERLFGFTAAELMADPNCWNSRVHPEDWEQVILPLFEALLAEGEATAEYRFFHRDGSLRWISAAYVSHRDEVANCWLVNGCAVDITERKATEERLRVQEERLRLALELTNTGFWDWNPQCNQGTWNANHFRLLGLEPQDPPVGYETWRNCVHPDDLEVTEATVLDSLQTGKNLYVEYRVIHPDGTVRWMTSRGKALYNAAGEAVRMVGTIVDISDRKQAEAERQAAEVNLRRYERLVEVTPDLMALVDRSYRYQLANPACLEWVPDHLEGLVGHTVADIIGEATFQTQYKAYFDRCLRGETVRFEAWFDSPKGQRHFMSVVLAPYSEQAGTIAGVVITARDLTNLKQAETALQHQQRLTDQIAEATLALLYVYDLIENRNVYVNPQVESILGYSPEEIQAMGSHLFVRLVHPADLPRLSQNFQRCFTLVDGEVLELEYRMQHKNGEWRWLLSRDKVFSRTATGAAHQIIGVATDITDLKQTEFSLRTAQQQYQTLVENSPDMIRRFDTELRYIYVSPAVTRLMGMPAASFLGKTCREIGMPEPLVHAWETLAQRLLATGEKQIAEFEALTLVGMRSFETVVVPEWDASGKIESILSISRDVTERKAAERALQKSEEQRRLAMELTNTSSWDFDVTTGEAVWSDSHYRLMGLTPEELPACYQTWRDRVHPDDLAWVERAIETALATQTPLEVEYRIVHPDGKTLWVLNKGHGIYSAAGQPIRMLGVMMDVTDRKAAEQALQRQVRREQSVNRLVRAIRQSLDLNAIVATAATEVARIMPIDHAVIAQYLPERKCWRHIAAYDQSGIVQHDLVREIPDENNSFAERLKRGEVVQVADVNQIDDDVNRAIAQTCVGAWLLVPVVVNGATWGSFSLRRQQAIAAWPPEQIELAQALADQMAIAIQQSQLFHQVQQLNQNLEQQVQQRTAQLKLALSVARMGTWEWDLRTDRQVWSQENYELWGFRTDEQQRVLLQDGTEVSPYPTFQLVQRCIHPDDREYMEQKLQEAREQGSIYEAEHRLVWPDGQVRWRYSRGAYLFDEAGVPIKLIGVGMDITERKRGEAQIRESLHEKEVLLKEIHHRVKNNLQIITSLLRMQSSQISDRQTILLLQEAQNRVQSMALIHEQLYRSPNLNSIDFGDYLQTLVRNLFRSYGVNPQKIVPTIDTEGLSLSVDAAIPCGLICNELVSNALKYAFPNDISGTVLVRLQPDTAQATVSPALKLIVADDGIGIPPEFDIEHTESLGLLIVRSLTSQLQGKLSLDRSHGTRFEVTFPYAHERG